MHCPLVMSLGCIMKTRVLLPLTERVPAGMTIVPLCMLSSSPIPANRFGRRTRLGPGTLVCIENAFAPGLIRGLVKLINFPTGHTEPLGRATATHGPYSWAALPRLRPMPCLPSTRQLNFATSNAMPIALSPMIAVSSDPLLGLINALRLVPCLSTQLSTREAMAAQSNVTRVRARLVLSTSILVPVSLHDVTVPLRLSRSVVPRLQSGWTWPRLCLVPPLKVPPPASSDLVPLVWVPQNPGLTTKRTRFPPMHAFLLKSTPLRQFLISVWTLIDRPVPTSLIHLLQTLTLRANIAPALIIGHIGLIGPPWASYNTSVIMVTSAMTSTITRSRDSPPTRTATNSEFPRNSLCARLTHRPFATNQTTHPHPTVTPKLRTPARKNT